MSPHIRLRPTQVPLVAQVPRHPAAAVERCFRELSVDALHQRQVQQAPAFPRPVGTRPVNPDQRALPGDRQRRGLRIDHVTPPHRARRPEALAKKSRSTASWPILAWSFPTSPAFSAVFASASPENSQVIPAIARRFQGSITA